MRSIILASGSPRRKQLLASAEIAFDVLVSDADESFPPHLSLNEVPAYIARNKAMAVSAIASPDSIIIAADTVVVLEDQIIGKPVDREDAIRMLTSLSGKTHRVLSGAVIRRGKEEIIFTDVTEVVFHALSEVQIRYYVEKFKPYDKAGAYAIQEWIGFVGVKSISGDYYNVMGLPVSRVIQALGTFK